MELIDLAAHLVAFDTVSQQSSTEQMASFISNYLETTGFTVAWLPYGAGKRKVNLIARKGSASQRCRLALSGHMDTVPFVRSQWRTDPLVLTEKDGRYYGMGIADMKLFDAIMMKAGATISDRELKHPFCLYFTSDEEVGCVGAKRLVNDLERRGELIADHVIVGEPTELCPKRLHKGYMYFKISISRRRDEHQIGYEDRSAHSSKPNQATNVVETMLPRIISAVSTFKRRLERVVDNRFDPPYPTMNIGGIIQTHQGAAKNVIPGYVAFENEIRPVPNQDPDDLLDLLRSVAQQAVNDITPIGDEKLAVNVDWVRAPTPPMETTEDSAIVREVQNMTGMEAGAVSYNTEGGIFNAAGAESVIWGPASIAQAHRDNEFAEQRWFHSSIVDKYVELIRRICCQ